MGLAILVVGLAVFLGVHSLVPQRPARAAAIARLGEWPYKALFSLLSLAGLVLIGVGFARYRASGLIELWSPPTWTRHIAVALMWPAFICITAAYVPGNLRSALRHPMLVGVKLWALAHLIANGDLGSIVLFGALLAWAVYDRVSLKYRSDAGAPPIPAGGRRNDIIAIVVGTILYLAFGLVFHPLWIGVAVFGTPAFGT